MRNLTMIGIAACLAASASAVTFTFDSDNEGWTDGNFGNGHAAIVPDTAGPSFWDAGGFISGTDHDSYAFIFSPNLGGGFGGAFGTELTMDYLNSRAQGAIPFVTLVSSTAFLVLERALAATGSQVGHSLTLDSSEGWAYNSSDYYGTAVAATDAEILAVLSDLRYIGVTSDNASGGDYVELDNVNINPVPEPATMVALGLGATALIRRRKK